MIKISRQARKKSPTGIYHLMLRGINRQNIFEEDEDYRKFIKTVDYYRIISKYELYAYCLMDNHVHLLMKENDESISKAIKRISSSYVYWYNLKYDRCGHLFQERFKSESVDTDAYFLTVLRYIHQNPVKAGITKSIQDYQWSSYHEYLGISRSVDIDFALKILSEDNEKARCIFRKYSNETNDDECLENKKKIILSDKKVIQGIKQFGVNTLCELQGLEIKRRNEVLAQMKKMKGVSIRQLARITGIPKSTIDRI